MLQKIRRDITARKMRTVLVVLSIAVGVFGVSAVIRISSQVSGAITEQFNRSNPPDITLSTSPLPANVVDQVARTPNVQATEGKLTIFTRWTPEKNAEDLQLVGVRDFNRSDAIARVTLREGAFPKAGEIMLESATKKYYSVKVGQRITVSGAAGELPLTISGVGENANYQPAATAGFGTGFVTFEDAARVAGFGDPNTLVLKVADIDQAKTTASALRAGLGDNQIVLNGVEIRDPAHPPGEDVSGLLSVLLGVFALIALITSSFLVVNTVSTVVAEQRGQIGAMKAVGATTGIVMRVFLGMALAYGILGTITGLLLGLVGSYGLLSLMSAGFGVDVGSFQISPPALIAGTVIGLLVPILAALLPVWLGSRVSVREAIMSYGLSSDFGKGILARLVLALVFLPQAVALAARNLLRNRLRVLLTVIGLAAAGASIISVYNANRSLAETIDDAVKTFNADMVFELAQPGPVDRAAAIVATVSGVSFSEGWFEAGVQNGENFNDKVTGLPVATRGYDIANVTEGRWFQPGDTNVTVITQQMARKRSFKIDDTVELTAGSNVVRWQVVGITRDLSSGDNNFLAPIEQATRAAGAPDGTVSIMLVKLDDTTRATIDERFDQTGRALNDGGVAVHGRILYKVQEQLTGTFNILFVMMYAVVVVVALVGGLGLFGTITMNVLERRREIGVMRSVGASTGTVLWVFLTEGLLLGLLGWVVAVILGYFGGRLFGSLITAQLLPIKVGMKPESLLLTLAVVMLVAFLSTLVPSISASRTRIATILRYG